MDAGLVLQRRVQMPEEQLHDQALVLLAQILAVERVQRELRAYVTAGDQRGLAGQVGVRMVCILKNVDDSYVVLFENNQPQAVRLVLDQFGHTVQRQALHQHTHLFVRFQSVDGIVAEQELSADHFQGVLEEVRGVTGVRTVAEEAVVDRLLRILIELFVGDCGELVCDFLGPQALEYFCGRLEDDLQKFK